MNKVEDKEQVDLRYTEAISDFAGCVQEHGAKKVAEDFFQYYPTQCQGIVDCVYQIHKEHRIAALLRP